ncbi:MFS transporter [Pigmentiphaga kullae]|uniref:Putative MFS family arabinose efflux permease n=1 Tax=Pigmentiphaga kullae TaxID=151784 RepID=A0A4Q7NFS6_9BURK|nr:MFS transporter [Pigmentiphaga kullae]RZS81920.1 putative MFS family arabinose efflux permease [Pigmentiphaga kullae]
MNSDSPSLPASTRSLWKARALVTVSLMTGVMGSSVPTPLYPLYQAQLNLPSFTTTAIFFAYVVGVLSALLVGGRLADRVADRRRLLLPALAMVATGAILLALAQNLGMLLAGRLLAGLGTGTLTGAANAALLDLEPPQHKQRAALFGTAAFTLGSILGPILSGVALQAGFHPTVAPFLVIVSIVLAVGHGLWRLPLRRTAAPAPAPHSPQAVHASARALPARRVTQLMLLCCITLSIVWGVGSSLMAMGPSLGEKLLGIHDYALSGYASSLLAACAGTAQFLSQRTSSTSAFRYGNMVFASGLACAIASLLVTQAWLMGVAVLITGLGFGAAFIGAAGIVNQIAPPQRRGLMVSLFYIAGYIGNAWPMLLGFITDHAGPMAAAMTLLLTAIAASAGFVALSRRLLPIRS